MLMPAANSKVDQLMVDAAFQMSDTMLKETCIVSRSKGHVIGVD